MRLALLLSLAGLTSGCHASTSVSSVALDAGTLSLFQGGKLTAASLAGKAVVYNFFSPH